MVADCRRPAEVPVLVRRQGGSYKSMPPLPARTPGITLHEHLVGACLQATAAKATAPVPQQPTLPTYTGADSPPWRLLQTHVAITCSNTRFAARAAPTKACRYCLHQHPVGACLQAICIRIPSLIIIARLMASMQRCHGNHLRKGRISESGRPYLITTVTCRRKCVFNDWKVGRLLVNEMRTASEAHCVDSIAWVIMPDHLHWLFILRDISLPAIIHRVKARSAIAINKHQGSSGRFWQKGFHDRAIRSEDDLQTVARYIVANPLRAGITKKIGNYPLWDAIWL
jgi:REP element-mobilizing transposase RayT